MLITFLISGGFAGRVRGCRIDTRSLPAADRRTLEALVAAAEISGSVTCTAPAARDLRQYELSIDLDGTVASLNCDERNVPERARDLVADLVGRSTPQPLSFAAAFPRTPSPGSPGG